MTAVPAEEKAAAAKPVRRHMQKTQTAREVTIAPSETDAGIGTKVRRPKKGTTVKVESRETNTPIDTTEVET